MNYIKFLWTSFLTSFKLSISLKLTLLSSVLLIALRQITYLLAWTSFFKNFKTVGNWDFNDFLLMHGIVAVSAGITEFFFYGLRELPNIIVSKKLDYLLTQPKNVIIKIAFSKIEVSSIGEAITGFFLIFYSGVLFKAPIFTFIILFQSIILVFALYLYLSCIAFFINNSDGILQYLRGMCFIASGQPNSGYSGFLKFITCTILPIAYWSFFPVEFIRTGNIKFLGISFLGTISLLIIAISIFNLGLRRYQSGNLC